MDEFTKELIASSDSQDGSSATSEENTTTASTTSTEPPVNAPSIKIKAPSPLDELLELAAGVELFHTPDGIGFAAPTINGHRETWRLRSREFSDWFKREFYLRHQSVPSAQVMRDALSTLEARARYDGTEEPVHMRIAEKNGTVYLDLGDKEWRAVAITPQGWQVVPDPPVKFRRSRGMQALPEPARGGHIDELRRFVNVDSDDAFYLLVAWLVGALRLTGPFAILALQGEQGSAKSTTARLLRRLIDPSTALARRTPRDERDLMIAARNAWILSFDNLSGLPVWLSDGLCSLATGGGFSTRALRTDDDEVIFSASRPLILNGIDGVTERPDLTDRAIMVSLPSIPDDKRQDEATLRTAFEEAAPRILGALLDGVSAALRNIGSVTLPIKPRMADFARWVTAAEEGFGWAPGTFIAAYTRNRAQAVEITLDTDIVAVAVRTLLARCQGGTWEGSATELHAMLYSLVPEHTVRGGDWPKAPNALTNRLGRIAPALRAVGILYEPLSRRGKAGKRGLRLHYAGPQMIVSTVSTVSGPARLTQNAPTKPEFSAESTPPTTGEIEHSSLTPAGGTDGPPRSADDHDAKDRQLAVMDKVPDFAGEMGRAADAADAVALPAGMVEAVPQDALPPQVHREASSLPALATAIRASNKIGLSVAATGPDTRRDRPCAVAIALPSREIHIVDLSATGELGPVGEALCEVLVIGHDLKLDLAHLANDLGLMPSAVFDTKPMCKLLDRGVHRDDQFFGLVETCKRVLNSHLPAGASRAVFTRSLAEQDISDIAEKVRPLLALEEAVRARLRCDRLEKLAEETNLRILAELTT